jgi:hypothetical protein
MFIDSWSTELSQFINSIAEIIATQDKVDFEEAQKLVKKGCRRYLTPCLVQQVEEFQGSPSILKNLKNHVQTFSSDNCLQKMLRRCFHMYQDLVDDTPRPRPINPSSEIFQNVQPIHDSLTSNGKTIDG